jgi:hypothetical protein
MKTPKKSTSHVVNLKRRTIDRIRKTQSPDVPPVSVKQTFIPAVEDEFTDEERLAMYESATYETPVMHPEAIESLMKLAEKFKLNDATVGLPPEALPASTLVAGCDPSFTVGGDKIIMHFTQLPVEHHGHQNDLAKSVISKVPTPKLDPNSDEAELARLQKSQLRTAKKKD